MGFELLNSVPRSLVYYYFDDTYGTVHLHCGCFPGSPPCATSPITALSTLTAACPLGTSQVATTPIGAGGATASALAAAGTFGGAHVSTSPRANVAAGSAVTSPSSFTAMQLQYMVGCR